MPKRNSTIKRHDAIRNEVYEKANQLRTSGIVDYANQAILRIADRYKYSYYTVRDIYYG